MARAAFTGSRLDVETKKRADLCIAQGALTNSKRPQSFVNGFYPAHVVRGQGVHLFDTQNFKYVDFICGLGANLLGYGFTLTTEAAIKALRDGPTLSLSSTKEIELAEKIKDIMPFVERVKFLKSGSEGCSAAIKIARSWAEGRPVVLSEGYHGWHDEFISLSPPAVGVPPHQFIRPLGESLEIGDDVGAVILEPVMTELSEVRIEWLRRLRDICTKKKICLIFDETITALRFPRFSVAMHLGIHPDLIVFGKALANGLPLSCVGGRAEIMECDYFVSSTYAGETASLASALACISVLQKSYDVMHLWMAGRRFQEKFNSISVGVKIEGYPTRGVLVGDDMPKALFMQEACRAGLIFGPSWFFAFPHVDLEDQIMSVLADVFLRLKSGSAKLEGDLPRKPVAQKMREQKA